MEHCTEHVKLTETLNVIIRDLAEIKTVLKGDYKEEGLFTEIRQLKWRIEQLEKFNNIVKRTGYSLLIKLIAAYLLGAGSLFSFLKLV